jgi:astacin (peptidase family M12A)
MSATKPEARRWPGPVVPYEIDPNFDNPNRIRDAIRNHWEAKTNIRFVRRAYQSDFVMFRHGQECNSPVGHQSGMQYVNLAPNCPVRSIIHEIGHASGLIHEHQRSDRNTFVQVQEANIQPGRGYNFDRIENSTNLTDYDLRSIMHYPTDNWAVGGMPTLLPIDPNAVLNTSTTFTPLDLQAINALYPNVGVVRRSDSGFQAPAQVSEIAVAHGFVASDVVTAVRTQAGILRLILWRINMFGGISRVVDSGDLAGQATSISIARGRLFVTACRSGSGRLLLISWSITGNQISRERDSGNAAGSASLIRILTLTDNLFVTACRDGSGNLLLITWRLNDNGSLDRLRTSEAGAVSEISLIRVRQVGTEHQVATTVRAGDGHVLSIIWNVAEGDGSIARLGDSSALMGEGGLIESDILPATGLLVVSCRTAAGILRVITLSVSGDGRVFERKDDSGDLAGSIQSNALMARPTGVLSAVKAGNNNLLLIRWGIDANGGVTRLGDSAPDQALGIGLVRLGNDTGQPAAPVLTCVQSAVNDLMLISWDDQSANGEL